MMLVKVRDNFHSISIPIIDDMKTKITIRIVYGGFEVKGSAISKGVDLRTIVNDITRVMSKYINKTSNNLCGCANLGEFAKKIVATVEPATSWSDVVLRLDKMGDGNV